MKETKSGSKISLKNGRKVERYKQKAIIGEISITNEKVWKHCCEWNVLYNKEALTFNGNVSACVSSNGKFHVLNNPMLWSTTIVVKHNFLLPACISHQHSTFSENVPLCTHDRGECSLLLRGKIGRTFST